MSVLKLNELNANTFLHGAHPLGCFLAASCKSTEPQRRRSASLVTRRSEPESDVKKAEASGLLNVSRQGTGWFRPSKRR